LQWVGYAAITLQLTRSSWKVLDNTQWQPLSALSKEYSS
jgi:hypothetical protein